MKNIILQTRIKEIHILHMRISSVLCSDIVRVKDTACSQEAVKNSIHRNSKKIPVQHCGYLFMQPIEEKGINELHGFK